jgi:hypothetical protein
MNCLRAVLTAIVMLAAILSAGAEERSVPDAQLVQLKNRAIGCGTVDSMVRIAVVYVTKGPDAARAIMPAGGEDTKVHKLSGSRERIGNLGCEH